MQATLSCMLVILLIAAELLLTLMGIRHTEGPYGTVRSSDQGENYKALYETPDCQSLLLQQSLPFAIINGIFSMLYSTKQTHSCCQLQAGGIIIVLCDSKAQRCLLP